MMKLPKEHLIAIFVNAMAAQEGFHIDNSPSQLNNNPGNMTVPGKGILAKYATLPEGWKAAEAQAEKNIFTRGLTFYEFFAGQRDEKGNVVPGGYPGYCPAPPQTGFVHKLLIGNRPGKYADFVISIFQGFLPSNKRQKITRDTVIKSLCL